jgi:predicted O-methyltransferase YrrM
LYFKRGMGAEQLSGDARNGRLPGKVGSAARACVGWARFVLSLRVLPPRVALFLVRARRHARRNRDQFSLSSAIRPGELATLFHLAQGRRAVVELGTGTAWSAIALALEDRARRVVSYDPCVRPEREAYLACAWPAAHQRIEFRNEPDSHGPRPGESVEMLFIDSSHDRESVAVAFGAWRESLAPGAVVAFHDYDHPSYPGVREAIDDLGLSGAQHGGLFVWHAPA